MIKYVTGRLLSMIPVLIGVTIVVFLLAKLIPGDPAQSILGADATPEAIDALREEMGLNDSILSQYGSWLINILQGDLGFSYTLSADIASELLPRFINTLILTAASLFICIVVGVFLGALSAIKNGRLFDKVSMAIAMIGASIPVFWIALMLMWVFSIQINLFPVGGMYNMRNPGGLFDLVSHLVLPAFATATVSIAVIARLSRNTMLETLQKDYIHYFHSFGIADRKINIRHALRNSLPPIINIAGLQVGYILGGALFSEVVFNWPGIGQQLYVAITSNDYAMIQGGILLIAISVVCINALVDILNVALSPKLRDSL
ncbi:ABC transporter permease [Shouchella patagoniensis]|uniref:ABC transporter permease n=1 Tax=Shouchella patagoniensis TaxID=228576 RepID=UPI000995D791|nr:ABC transporter permease [Shouchella patagoniensis]